MYPKLTLPQTTPEGLLMLGGLLLVFCWCNMLIRMLQIEVYKLHTAACALAALLSLIFYHNIRITVRENHIALPFLPVMAGFALQVLLLILMIRFIRRKARIQLSAMSFKEAFDTIPTGICFFRSSGMPQLVNPQMAHIFRQITGAHLSNAAEFYSNLRSGSYPCSVTGGDRPIVCLDDGTAYSFTHYTVTVNGEKLHELIAADISDEYQMTLELERKQKQIRIINKRLRALNSTMRYIIMEKEVLSLKTKIHDETGAALLLGKRCLLHPEEVDAKKMLLQWKLSFGLLLNEQRESWQIPYLINTKHANLLGVKLNICGKLPEEEHLIHIVDTAIAVHVNNTLRHAEGNEATIEIAEHTGYYLMYFTNNGKPPLYGVKETGGLSNLRSITEHAGGGMKIRSLPRFVLTLKLPKRKRRDTYEL